MAKERLDVMMAERGLAESREQAQRLIMAGLVTVDGERSEKPGRRYDAGSSIELGKAARFVGRGGEKLEGAFQAFGLTVDGMICLDVGASTGGFTDCLLQHGAAKVFSVDVGKGQLHWKLRKDPRVTVMDKVNARYMRRADFPDPIRFACVDVAFISLTKVLPAVIQVLAPESQAITLIKPQFEVERGQVGKGGVVRDSRLREASVEKVRAFGVDELGLDWLGMCESPIRGPAGNVEFLAWWRKGQECCVREEIGRGEP